VEDGTGDAMPPFAPVEFGQRSSPLGFVVDVGQRVQRLVDSTVFGDSLCEPGGAVANLKGAHDAGGWNSPEFEGAREAEHIVPVRCIFL
jgi:hypothetical protein